MSLTTDSMKVSYNSGESGHSCTNPCYTAKAGDIAVQTRTLLDAVNCMAARSAGTELPQ